MKLKLKDISKHKFKKIKLIDFDKKDLSWKETFSGPITKAFIINVVVFIVLNAIAYARFENDADIMINALLSNVSGTRGTSHVGFISSIIMEPIYYLTKTFPKFAWYTWFVVICAFVSITILNWLLLRKRSDRHFIILVTVLDIFVGYECYMFPSYIKSVVIGTFAVMMLLLHLVNTDGIKKVFFIIPGIGLVFNSLFSFRGFILGLLSATVICLIHLLIVNRNKKRLLFICVFIFLTILITLGMHLFDRNAEFDVKSDENIIGEYIDDIEKLIVFGYPEYEKDYEDEYFLTEEKYRYLVAYNDFFTRERSAESIRFIHDLADSKIVFTGEKLLEFFRTIPIRMIKVGYTFLFIIIAFVFMISNHKYRGRYVWMMIGYLFIVYGIAYFNYAWDNKVIQMVAFLPATYFLLINMPIASEIENKDLILYLVLMSVILYNNFSDKIVTSVGNDDLNDFFEEMVADEEKTAVFDLNGFYRGRSPYEPYIEGWIEEDNLILIDGYYTLFPEFNNYQYFSHLGEWIVHNGTTDVNMNIYLVCRETDTDN